MHKGIKPQPGFPIGGYREGKDPNALLYNEKDLHDAWVEAWKASRGTSKYIDFKHYMETFSEPTLIKNENTNQ